MKSCDKQRGIKMNDIWSTTKTTVKVNRQITLSHNGNYCDHYFYFYKNSFLTWIRILDWKKPNSICDDYTRYAKTCSWLNRQVTILIVNCFERTKEAGFLFWLDINCSSKTVCSFWSESSSFSTQIYLRGVEDFVLSHDLEIRDALI